jgi:DNA-binding XRE family transcriptional regulator
MQDACNHGGFKQNGIKNKLILESANSSGSNRFMMNEKWHFPIIYWRALMNIIGENIRKLRKMAGLTQIEFAKQIGISQGTLSDIEQGNSNPSVDTVLSIHK